MSLYKFNLVGGGFNVVTANSKQEALVEIRIGFSRFLDKIDMSSLKKLNKQEEIDIQPYLILLPYFDTKDKEKQHV